MNTNAMTLFSCSMRMGIMFSLKCWGNWRMWSSSQIWQKLLKQQLTCHLKHCTCLQVMLVVDPGVLQLTERNSPQKESEKEMKTNANSLGLSCYVLLNTLFESRAVLLCSLLFYIKYIFRYCLSLGLFCVLFFFK